jgi:hypothetical protein
MYPPDMPHEKNYLQRCSMKKLCSKIPSFLLLVSESEFYSFLFE